MMYLSLSGVQDDGKLSLHNHLRFTILYHRDIETDLSRIVGFEVKPFSVQHKYDGSWNEDKPGLSTCNPGSMKYVSDKDDPQEMKEGKEVIFTYDVVYEVRFTISSNRSSSFSIRDAGNTDSFAAWSCFILGTPSHTAVPP